MMETEEVRPRSGHGALGAALVLRDGKAWTTHWSRPTANGGTTELIGLGQAQGQAGAASSASCAALLPGVRVDIVVHDDVVDAVVTAIAKCANTGTIGDGKIWVSPIDSVLRTRTGERDNSVI